MRPFVCGFRSNRAIIEDVQNCRMKNTGRVRTDNSFCRVLHAIVCIIVYKTVLFYFIYTYFSSIFSK